MENSKRNNKVAKKKWQHPTEAASITFQDVYYTCEDKNHLIQYPDYKICVKRQLEIRKL